MVVNDVHDIDNDGDRDGCQQLWHVNGDGENANLMIFKYFPTKAAAELKGRCPIDKTHRNQVFFHHH